MLFPVSEWKHFRYHIMHIVALAQYPVIQEKLKLIFTDPLMWNMENTVQPYRLRLQCTTTMLLGQFSILTLLIHSQWSSSKNNVARFVCLDICLLCLTDQVTLTSVLSALFMSHKGKPAVIHKIWAWLVISSQWGNAIRSSLGEGVSVFRQTFNGLTVNGLPVMHMISLIETVERS